MPIDPGPQVARADCVVKLLGSGRAATRTVGPDHLYPLYHLAAYWGLRRNELTGLQWADADLATRRLHVAG